jgi:hypothetical protein
MEGRNGKNKDLNEQVAALSPVTFITRHMSMICEELNKRRKGGNNHFLHSTRAVC